MIKRFASKAMKFVRKYAFGPLLLAVAIVIAGAYIRSTDDYIRNRVLQLYSEHGRCTGVEIITPSGKAYTLTAAHCVELVQHKQVKATDEAGNEYSLTFIAEDAYSDLMLLSAPGNWGIDVAHDLQPRENVHSMTHGLGMPTYRTDGVVIGTDSVVFAMYKIASVSDLLRCTGIKYRLIEGFCVVKTNQTISTTLIVPGSSGGPLLNSWGELVGIASTRGDFFYTFVTLSDIQAFLYSR